MRHTTHECTANPHQSRTHTQKLILFVDDDPIFRHVISDYLSALSYRVVEAASGLEGLQKLRRIEPDLIICDLSMPVLNGIEFVAEVSETYPELPMIVVSGTEAMSDVAQALRYGIKDFLSKPIRNLAYLSHAIENTLDDALEHWVDQRDFSSQWFRIDEGELPEEKELHWHLEHLRNSPDEARMLLHALLPNQEAFQGRWKCSYRLLQSAEVMPVVFDYAWLSNEQFGFYLVDTASNEREGVATTLLIRALFHDYLRHLNHHRADLNEFVALLEKGIQSSECAGSIQALFGLVDPVKGEMSLMPAGLGGQWIQSHQAQPFEAGLPFGARRKSLKGISLPFVDGGQLLLNATHTYSFQLNLTSVSGY